MVRRIVPLLLVAACASKGGPGVRGQGEPEVAVPAAPAGNLQQTARNAKFADVLDDLAQADVAFVAAGNGIRLSVLEYLFARGRLHAIGLESFPRTAQKALDDFSFQRIDEAELEKRCGPWPEDCGPVLAFARERRLPLLGLGVEAEVRAAFAGAGRAALTEEQSKSLSALPSTAPDGTVPIPVLEREVAADVIVRWYVDAAPEGAQVVVLAARERIAPRDGLPERVFARSGKRYRTLVELPLTVEAADGAVFARSYADYVWFTGGE